MNFKLPVALLPVKDVLIFLLLLFSFHFVYLGWSVGLNFYPVAGVVQWLFMEVAEILMTQSILILQFVGSEFEVQGATFYINNTESFVSVLPECTTLKQWLHWMVIMGFFPGPWRHKLWYIPAGIIVIHLTNLFRIVGLLFIQIPFPGSFHFFHDNIFKTLFYANIFFMWLLWNEYFRKMQR
ncbi:MAG TPA: hypothetical protein VLH61_07170 [Bacteroidales bacterium]|nr:hypothetical protein [Bacteroidales bacterium]